jgi:hypothetical protein
MRTSLENTVGTVSSACTGSEQYSSDSASDVCDGSDRPDSRPTLHVFSRAADEADGADAKKAVALPWL